MENRGIIPHQHWTVLSAKDFREAARLSRFLQSTGFPDENWRPYQCRYLDRAVNGRTRAALVLQLLHAQCVLGSAIYLTLHS
jgi:hypothetical protein